MKTVINGRDYMVKQTGQKFFYWSPRALRWFPVKRSNVIFEDRELANRNASFHAATLAKARALRGNGSAHALLLEAASIYRMSFKKAREEGTA